MKLSSGTPGGRFQLVRLALRLGAAPAVILRADGQDHRAVASRRSAT